MVERAGEHPGQLHHASLTGRQQPGLQAGERADPGELDGLVDRPVDGGRVTRLLTNWVRGCSGQGRLATEHDVLAHGQRVEELGPLERPAQAEPGSSRRPDGGDVVGRGGIPALPSA